DELDSLYLKPQSVYEEAGYRLVLGEHVDAIDRDNKQLSLSNGDVLPYDKLVLATGSQVRRLNAPGADLEGIYYLRDIAHADEIRGHFGQGKRLVIVGGGYIGLEVASAAVKAGLDVTVLE